MPTTETKKTLLQIFTAGMLLIGCVAMFGCSSLSRLNVRLTQLAAPQKLARSAGGVYATTDTYLAALEVSDPSERVLTVVKQLSEGDVMMFIAPDSEQQTELVYRSIASLSWPRQIGALHCGAKGESPTVTFKPGEDKKIRWLIFYRRQVPTGLSDSHNSIELGAHLKFTPVQETKEWTFYCSQ